jgi:putative methionine-R-sulfoxide reductase with GAF domain
MTADALRAIDAALAEEADADDALRRVVRVLADRTEIVWAGILFVEAGDLVLGPTAGVPDEARRTPATVCYKDEAVGELQVDGDVDPGFLAAVAERIAAHVLLGWDTAGEAWEP